MTLEAVAGLVTFLAGIICALVGFIGRRIIRQVDTLTRNVLELKGAVNRLEFVTGEFLTAWRAEWGERAQKRSKGP